MWRWLAILVAVATLSALSGVGAYQLVRPAIERSGARWQEIAWSFPRDGWPAGRAFRCASCGDGGAAVELYVRPKIGFCNCDTGVADDDEVDRVADLDLISERLRLFKRGRWSVWLTWPAARVAMISGCPMVRITPPSASRCHTAAISWSRSRKAGRMPENCNARRWHF